MRINRLLPLLLLLSVLVACGRQDGVAPEFEGGEGATLAKQGGVQSFLIIASNQLPSNLEAVASSLGATVTATVDQVGVAVASSDNPNFASEMAAQSGIRSVVPDVTIPWATPVQVEDGVSVDAFGNPPTSGDDDFFFDLQWGHDGVDSPEAWNGGQRGAGVRVAILDSGIDADHPDIAPNLNTALSTSFVPGEGFDIQPGFYFNHGTHVGGIVGAADNAFGVIGVAPEVELVAVKVLSEFTGGGTFSGVIAGIVYAADIDADIINMSLGATFAHRGTIFDQNGNPVGEVPAEAIAELAVAMGRATSYAHQQGTTIIASAGNAGTDGDHDQDRIHLPSDSPHVLSISATGPLSWAIDPSTDLDVPAFYTNHGQSVIDFAAPGGNVDFSIFGNTPVCTVVLTRPCWVFDLVFSTISGGWGWAAGTSMAAPHASAVAAVIIGQNGGSMHPNQVKAALRQAADDLGKPGNDDFYGLGRVNAGNAVN